MMESWVSLELWLSFTVVGITSTFYVILHWKWCMTALCQILFKFGNLSHCLSSKRICTRVYQRFDQLALVCGWFSRLLADNRSWICFLLPNVQMRKMPRSSYCKNTLSLQFFADNRKCENLPHASSLSRAHTEDELPLVPLAPSQINRRRSLKHLNTTQWQDLWVSKHKASIHSSE